MLISIFGNLYFGVATTLIVLMLVYPPWAGAFLTWVALGSLISMWKG